MENLRELVKFAVVLGCAYYLIQCVFGDVIKEGMSRLGNDGDHRGMCNCGMIPHPDGMCPLSSLACPPHPGCCQGLPIKNY